MENVFWDMMEERAQDTIKSIREGREPNIVRYALHVTSLCNMRCVYCKEDKINPQMIDRNLFREICDKAGSKGIVHITGGEPLMVPWLEEEIVNYKGKIKFILSSNLLKMPERETLESVYRVKTSLDDYDSLRWNKIVGGDYFDTVVENIKMVSEVVEYTSICYTATHWNADRLEGFVEFCNREFPNLFLIHVSFVKGNKGLALTDDDVVKLFDATKLMNETSRKVFHEMHTHKGNCFPGNWRIPCYLTRTERMYDEYGREFYCTNSYREKLDAPGRPGKELHCMFGCNEKFADYNKRVHKYLT